MNLCCQVQPKAACKVCKSSFCLEHLYKTRSRYTTIEDKDDEYTCIVCYDKKVRKPSLARKRKGMTFKDLFREVRLILPHGYVSVDVSLDDHHPGQGTFNLEWTVYHEKYGHTKGPTPEKVLCALRKILELPSEQKKEQVDI